MAGVVIGIDLGTTVLKVAAFDRESGTVRAQAAADLAVHSGADGAREQRPADIDAALDRTMGDLSRELGAAWAEVTGIGLAAQAGSGMICDRRSGRPMTVMSLWNDGRQATLLAELTAARPRDYWQRLHQRPGAGHGLARIGWFRQRSPDLFRADTIYVGAGEYAFHQLTGQWFQDPGNAVQIGCYDVPNRCLTPEPLSLVGLDLNAVAPMRPGHTPSPLRAAAAQRFGLPVDVPVVGPYFDHEAGYLTAVEASRRPLQCSLGTAWVANVLLPRTARWSAPCQLVIPAPVGDGWQVVCPLFTGNPSWDWGLSTLLEARSEARFRDAEAVFAERLLPPPHLVCIPWLARPNTFCREAFGAGMWLGVSPHCDRRDLLRALVFGMCAELYRVLADVRSRDTVDRAVVAGGASKAPIFNTLIAALFAPLPVHPVRDSDLAGCRGAVYAFSTAAARSPLAAAVQVEPHVIAAVSNHRDVYMQTFRNVLGQRPEAGALSVTATGEMQS